MTSRPASTTLLLLAACIGACQSPTSDSAGAGTHKSKGATSSTSTKTSGLDVADMDRSVQPCIDFYRYANGGWLDRTTIPPEYPSWDSFTEVHERNNVVLRQILDESAKDRTARVGSNRQKLGSFWAAAMDEKRAESEGAAPLEPWFARIAAVHDLPGLRAQIADMHVHGITPLFVFFAQQDFTDATRFVATAYQGGLGLPDRDYYTRDDAESAKLREQYVEHVARMFELIGEDGGTAAVHAAGVMALETELARASMTLVEQRDPQAVYNLMPVEQVRALTPNWDWTRYFEEIGVAGLSEVNVSQPEYFRRVDELLVQESLESWKTYLRWQLVDELAPMLSSAFVEEDFRFNGQILSGSKELRPRWKRALAATDQALGEALGELYVAKAFSPEAKRRAKEMVKHLEAAFRERLQTREWMSDATRQQALLKLDAFVDKIGYPDKWRDYSKLKIDPKASYAANVIAGWEFEFRRTLDKIGKPVDRTEWGMSPQTVNAYYNPSMNEIVFPAGILQHPYFDEKQDDALNYGAMGAIIGHEMSHGFDDEGSQFDAVGNLREWWTPADREEFERRSQLIVEQFNGYVAIDDLHVDGELTLGENIADLGGLTIAYRAFQRSLRGKPRPPLIDGMTAEQRFFVGWARGWRAEMRPELMRQMVYTNVHAPDAMRAVGPLQNMPEFVEAFDCAAGSPMLRAPTLRAEIW